MSARVAARFIPRVQGESRRISSEESEKWWEKLAEAARASGGRTNLPKVQRASERLRTYRIAATLTCIPAQYKVVGRVQTTYSCLCCERKNDHVPMKKSAVPSALFSGSRGASPDLLAHILNSKYVCWYSLLYWQEQEFQRAGVPISRQTTAKSTAGNHRSGLLCVYAAQVHRPACRGDLCADAQIPDEMFSRGDHGCPLLTMDLERIRAANHSATVMMALTNGDGFSSVEEAGSGEIQPRERRAANR